MTCKQCGNCQRHEARLTISRPSYNGDEEGLINIIVRDKDAAINFLRITISLSDFAKCITGEGSIPCHFESNMLENVGLVREMQDLTFPMPENSRFDKSVARSEALKHVLPGWVVNDYFGSQNSFFTKDGQHYAKTTMYRWVEKQNEVCNEGD